MSVVHNERVKLSATALNNVAVATIVARLIAPMLSFAYGWWVGRQ